MGGTLGRLVSLAGEVVSTGKAIIAQHRPFYMERGGGPKITYFDISYSPIYDDGGQVDTRAVGSSRSPVSPIMNSQGRVIGASKIARDITDRKASERVQALLAAELTHRVKNMLATVMAIARQTFAGTADPEAARKSFDARLQSLAGAHDLLTRENWQSANISDVIHRAVAPYSRERSRYRGLISMCRRRLSSPWRSSFMSWQLMPANTVHFRSPRVVL